MSRKMYEKIESVMKTAGRPLTEFEFSQVPMPAFEGDNRNGRQYVNASESTLGRRLREMRQIGRVVSRTREGRAFKEYHLPVKAPANEPVCPA